MNAVRIRGLLAIAAGVALLAPPFAYLWVVDYAQGYMAPWVEPFLVAFCAPVLLLIARGGFAAVSGKALPRISPLRLRR